MTTEKKEAQEFLAMDFRVSLPCRFDAGPYMGFFLTQMRDHKKIWANKCPKCGRLSSPPSAFCGPCLGVEMTEWVEQVDEGVLQGFDVVYYRFIQPNTGEMQPVPWAHGFIELDTGAFFWHYVVPPDPEKLKIGDRFKAVWKEEGRKGEFHDILYFKKVE